MFLDEWFTLVKANQSRIMQSLELRIRVKIYLQNRIRILPQMKLNPGPYDKGCKPN